MSLLCAMGMAACLNFQGQSFSADQALSIVSSCEDLIHSPARSFATPPAPDPNLSIDDQAKYQFRYYLGYVTAEYLDHHGLKLAWDVPPAVRRGEWVRTCVSFRDAFYRNDTWTGRP